MTIFFLFFESALELIPTTHRNHPLIRKVWRNNVKKKQKGVLLDGAIHRIILDSLPNAEKRGRPDIIHTSLLNLCYSPLFTEMEIKILIHTIDDFCIEIPSKWRVPVNYNRFSGLFSQLLHKNKVPISGEPILSVDRATVYQIIKKLGDITIYLCEVNYNSSLNIPIITNLDEISTSKSILFLIGGFQHGNTAIDLEELKSYQTNIYYLKIYEEIKPTWVIAAKLIHWLERNLLP